MSAADLAEYVRLLILATMCALAALLCLAIVVEFAELLGFLRPAPEPRRPRTPTHAAAIVGRHRLEEVERYGLARHPTPKA